MPLVLLAVAPLLGTADISGDVGTVALKARHMFDGQRTITDAVLLIRDGKVLAAGPASGLQVPDGTEVIDLGDRWILPGLVAAGSSLPERDRVGEDTIRTDIFAADAFDPYGNYDLYLMHGVTSVYLTPGSGRLVSGRGAVAKLGGPAAGRMVARNAGLQVQVGDPAEGAPDKYTPPLPPTGDDPVRGAKPQLPSSRMGAFMALRRALRDGTLQEGGDGLWRIGCADVASIRSALGLAREFGLEIVLEGAQEGHLLADEIADTGFPVVVQIPLRPGSWYPGGLVEQNRDEVRLDVAAVLSEAGVPIAIAGGPAPAAAQAAAQDQRSQRQIQVLFSGRSGSSGSTARPAYDLLMLAGFAASQGLDADVAMRGVTSSAAEILGVDDRIGSLEAGLDADFVVLSGPPMAANSRVESTWIGGETAWENSKDSSRILVLRAGTVLPVNGQAITGGAEVLVEGGEIRGLGRDVGRPLGAEVRDYGPDAVIIPGLIDAQSHMDLARFSTKKAGVDLTEAINDENPDWEALAEGGVTSVAMTTRGADGMGTRFAVVKTRGDDRVVEDLAALKYSWRGSGRATKEASFRKVLGSGKAYVDSWAKYETDIVEWNKKQAEEAAANGAKPEEKKDDKKEEEKKEEKKDKDKEEPDPVTGTWEASADIAGFVDREDDDICGCGTDHAGPVLPVALADGLNLVFHLRREKGVDGLLGSVTSAQLDVTESSLLDATWDADEKTLAFTFATPHGDGRVEGRVDSEDHMEGTVSLGSSLRGGFEATRIIGPPEEEEEEDKPERGKTPKGMPKKPSKKDDLEPYKALFAGAIPAVVDIERTDEIERCLRVFHDEFGVRLVLLQAEDAFRMTDELASAGAAVILPVPVAIRRPDLTKVVPGPVLARHGIPVMFQSGADETGRFLRLTAAAAVRAGMNPDDALRSLTLNAARAFGVAERLGSIERGKDADLVVLSGRPFDMSSRILEVLVGGEVVE